MTNKDIQEFISYDDTCSYLKDETSKFHYILYPNCNSTIYQLLLERGYRRFGLTFFRHMCPQCTKCKSIRIKLSDFTPNKNQRRVLNKCSSINIELKKPTFSNYHLALFEKYHTHQSFQKNWEPNTATKESYLKSYVNGAQDYGHEIQYKMEDKIIAIGLVDILENSFSSVYFYYDPQFSHLSLGTFSILAEIQLAQQLDLQYYYLGYWIQECPSMNYKAKFKPHELLLERPNLQENPNWIKIPTGN